VVLREKGNCSSKLLLGSGRGEGGAAQHREKGAWEKLIAILGRRGIHFQKCLKGSVDERGCVLSNPKGYGNAEFTVESMEC